MAGRILSVRERTLRAIRSHLSGITRKNGYEFDVRRVITPNSVWVPGVNARIDPPEIHVLPGTVREKIRNIGQYWGILPIKAMLFLKWRTEDAELEMDMFASQVRRRILEGMEDSSSAVTHPIELDSQAGFDYRRFLDLGVESGVVVGAFGFDVKYSYLSTDDRKWSTDDVHVTE